MPMPTTDADDRRPMPTTDADDRRPTTDDRRPMPMPMPMPRTGADAEDRRPGENGLVGS
jgi:hypothetical protein